MPATDTCISGIFTPGAIDASAGLTPTKPTLPTLEDPENYDPNAVTYSLDQSKFYNSLYLGAIY